MLEIEAIWEEGAGGKQVANLSAGIGSWFSVGQCLKCEYEVPGVLEGEGLALRLSPGW